MNEYLNPWYILAETRTRRHVIMMHFGNGINRMEHNGNLEEND